MLRRFVTASQSLVLATLFATTAECAFINLIPNGDFEQGSTLFSSDYEESPGSNPTESQYAVLTNPYPWNPNFLSVGDHTTGQGLMFVGNGSPSSADRVWSVAGIQVTPGVDYVFKAFAMNVVDVARFPQGADPATFSNLGFYINGTLLGNLKTNEMGIWQKLSATWNSGSAVIANLEIYNLNNQVAGNDFAIDDLFLGRDSTVVTEIPPVPEPSTGLLVVVAAGILAAGRRARTQRNGA